MTPEDAIETGIYNRLTHTAPPAGPHYGITVAAGHYCADNGGVQVWQGDVSLDTESLIAWAHAGLAEGPICLIVVGNDVDFEHDRDRHVVGEYTVQIYLASAHYRSMHEAVDGDVGLDTRKPGIRQMRKDVLDRLLAFGLAVDDNGAYQSNLVLKRGTLLAVDKGLALYRLDLIAQMGTRHDVTAWAALPNLQGVDVTLVKEPSATLDTDDFRVVIKTD